MKVFEANILPQVLDFFKDNLKMFNTCEDANLKMLNTFGILHFFTANEDLETLKDVLSDIQTVLEEPDREEYGDFQTNSYLANKVVLHLVSKNCSPEIIIEPTCGKGNFIIAALRNFKKTQKIYAIEIYKPYVWETKFNIVDFFLSNTSLNKPEILVVHYNVFDFDFKEIAKKNSTKNILVIGNPPWVTNSKLGTLNSTNLPKKSNFKNHNGLDAITGKGNFDIAEYITLKMVETFQNINGNLLLLVKNSVIKNIVFDQSKNNYKISSLQKHCIDSKMEFNVSVDAAFFFCQFNSLPTYNCDEFDFYSNQLSKLRFGWVKDKFVSNINTYIHTKDIDGESPFVWRQGLKHDCSSIMELDKVNKHYVNGLNEEIELEDDLIYGLLKSSDLKNTVINQTRKFTIVTQKKVGQETKYIKIEYPKTYEYLTLHQSNFAARKSSIYNNKPPFSIFGIGDYSFKPYKIAISGLYKTFHFSLILPQDNKPVMLDDTCYLIGFDNIEFAVYTLILLNSDITVKFLQSITFPDAKRTFTKDILMRINLLKLAEQIPMSYLQSELKKLNEMYKWDLKLTLWESYINEMMPINSVQIKMFV